MLREGRGPREGEPGPEPQNRVRTEPAWIEILLPGTAAVLAAVRSCTQGKARAAEKRLLFLVRVHLCRVVAFQPGDCFFYEICRTCNNYRSLIWIFKFNSIKYKVNSMTKK